MRVSGLWLRESWFVPLSGLGVRGSGFKFRASAFVFFVSGEYPFDDLGSDFARDCPAKGLGLGIGLGVSSLSITLSVQGLVKSVIFWLRDQGFRSRDWGSEFGGWGSVRVWS